MSRTKTTPGQAPASAAADDSRASPDLATWRRQTQRLDRTSDDIIRTGAAHIDAGPMQHAHFAHAALLRARRADGDTVDADALQPLLRPLRARPRPLGRVARSPAARPVAPVPSALPDAGSEAATGEPVDAIRTAEAAGSIAPVKPATFPDPASTQPRPEAAVAVDRAHTTAAPAAPTARVVPSPGLRAQAAGAGMPAPFDAAAGAAILDASPLGQTRLQAAPPAPAVHRATQEPPSAKLASAAATPLVVQRASASSRPAVSLGSAAGPSAVAWQPVGSAPLPPVLRRSPLADAIARRWTPLARPPQTLPPPALNVTPQRLPAPTDTTRRASASDAQLTPVRDRPRPDAGVAMPLPTANAGHVAEASLVPRGVDQPEKATVVRSAPPSPGKASPARDVARSTGASEAPFPVAGGAPASPAPPSSPASPDSAAAAVGPARAAAARVAVVPSPQVSLAASLVLARQATPASHASPGGAPRITAPTTRKDIRSPETPLAHASVVPPVEPTPGAEHLHAGSLPADGLSPERRTDVGAVAAGPAPTGSAVPAPIDALQPPAELPRLPARLAAATAARTDPTPARGLPLGTRQTVRRNALAVHSLQALSAGERGAISPALRVAPARTPQSAASRAEASPVLPSSSTAPPPAGFAAPALSRSMRAAFRPLPPSEAVSPPTLSALAPQPPMAPGQPTLNRWPMQLAAGAASGAPFGVASGAEPQPPRAAPGPDTGPAVTAASRQLQPPATPQASSGWAVAMRPARPSPRGPALTRSALSEGLARHPWPASPPAGIGPVALPDVLPLARSRPVNGAPAGTAIAIPSASGSISAPAFATTAATPRISAPATRPMLQRVAMPTSPASAAAVAAPLQAARPGPSPQGASGPDLEALVEKTCARLLESLAIEQERRGVSPWR